MISFPPLFLAPCVKAGPTPVGSRQRVTSCLTAVLHNNLPVTLIMTEISGSSVPSAPLKKARVFTASVAVGNTVQTMALVNEKNILPIINTKSEGEGNPVFQRLK